MSEIGSRDNLANWRNPYVTDGLEIMWDGVWNYAPGVHNSEITTWTDITGNGHNAIPSLAKTIPLMSWEKDTLVISSPIVKEAYVPQFTFNTASLKQHSLNNGSFTFECIANELVFASGCIIRITQPSTSWLSIRLSYGTWYFATPTGQNWMDYHANGIVHHRLVFQSNGNGIVKITSDETTETKNIATRCEIDNVGYIFGGSDISVKGQVHCMRLYTRMLSDEELTKNYEIDKKRFGI